MYDIDPNTMILGLLFIMFFLIIQFALRRMLKKAEGTTSIIAFCMALLAIYGLNRINFDLTGIFYGMGINEGTIYTVIPILILVGIGLMIWKLKIALTLLYAGLFLVAASFFTYEKEAVLIAGGVLVVLGIIGWIIKKKH